MSFANRSISRRRIVSIGLGTALLGVLAACAPAATPTPVPPAKPAEAPKPAAPAPAAPPPPAPAAAATKPAEAAKPAEAPKPADPAKPAEAAKPATAAAPAGQIAPAAVNMAKAKGANIKILIASDFRYEAIKGYAVDFEKEFGAKITYDPVSAADLPNK